MGPARIAGKLDLFEQQLTRTNSPSKHSSWGTPQEGNGTFDADHSRHVQSSFSPTGWHLITVHYSIICQYLSFPWYDAMKQVMTMGGISVGQDGPLQASTPSSPGKRKSPTPPSIGSWGYPGVPVTDMAQAQLEALKALQATNAGAGQGQGVA